MRAALVLVAVLLAGCASTKEHADTKLEYYLKCGFTLTPFANAQQWPEPLCKNGPPR